MAAVPTWHVQPVTALQASALSLVVSTFAPAHYSAKTQAFIDEHQLAAAVVRCGFLLAAAWCVGRLAS